MSKFQTKTFNGVRPMLQLASAMPEWVAVPIEFPTATPVANDMIEICELQIGQRCLDWTLMFPDIDSAGPALVTSLGVMETTNFTDLSAEVWGAALTAGQTAAPVRAATSASSQGDITTQRRIGLKVTTAAATYAGATKVGYLLMLLQNAG